MISNLMTGIATLLTTDARQDAVDLRAAFGEGISWGSMPNLDSNGDPITYPYMSYHVVDNDDEQSAFSDGGFDNEVDYYSDINVQFSIATYAPEDANGGSPLPGALLAEKLKNLFRMQSVPLPSGRVLCATIGPNIPTQTGDTDGVDNFVTVIFSTGT